MVAWWHAWHAAHLAHVGIWACGMWQARWLQMGGNFERFSIIYLLFACSLSILVSPSLSLTHSLSLSLVHAPSSLCLFLSHSSCFSLHFFPPPPTPFVCVYVRVCVCVRARVRAYEFVRGWVSECGWVYMDDWMQACASLVYMDVCLSFSSCILSLCLSFSSCTLSVCLITVSRW
jgi:hypothetical protein